MKRSQLWLCTALAFAACGEEGPLSVGGELLPQDAIRTFEVVLDADRYLVWDTAFGLYSAPSDADFTILASEFEGALDSRALVRYSIPRTIQVRDAAGTIQVDSAPVFFAGHVRFIVDTLSSTPAPADVELYRTTEAWDRRTATWKLRVDSVGEQLRWSSPGGSPGRVISTAGYGAAGDTVMLPVDSATLALWADTSETARGAVIGVTSPGTRLRTSLPTLRLQARSEIDPDTVIELSVAPGRTFIFSPEQPDSVAVPRVGGTPAWRTVLRLREGLDTVTVPCPGEPGCRVRLGATTINYAALVLQPQPSPAGFTPEAAFGVTAHILLASSRVPLQRSPVTSPVGSVEEAIPPSSFMAPDAPAVELPLTEVLRLLTANAGTGEEFVPSYLALLPGGTNRTFGFGTFAEHPRLRLVLSMTQELQLP